MSDGHAPGDEWKNHYPSYRLHTNQEGDVWWQVYDGTDRLYLDPTLDDLIEAAHKTRENHIREPNGEEVTPSEFISDINDLLADLGRNPEDGHS